MENCARDFLDDGVEASASGIIGPTSCGRLNEAKMVMLSRRQKRERETLGILSAGGACVDWRTGWQTAGLRAAGCCAGDDVVAVVVVLF